MWSTVSLGTRTLPGPRVGDTIDEFLQAVDAGTARDRHGRPFGREAARELHRSLESYIGSELGERRLNYVRRQHLEALLEGLEGAGVPPLRLAALATSLGALYDYAAEQDLVRHNPAEGVGVRYKLEEPETAHALHQGRSHRSPDDPGNPHRARSPRGQVEAATSGERGP